MERSFKGVWIPADLWECQGLTFLEKGLIAQIDSLDVGTRRCYASNAYFGGFFDRHPNSVGRVINKLVAVGVLGRTINVAAGNERSLWVQHGNMQNFINKFKKPEGGPLNTQVDTLSTPRLIPSQPTCLDPLNTQVDTLSTPRLIPSQPTCLDNNKEESKEEIKVKSKEENKDFGQIKNLPEPEPRGKADNDKGFAKKNKAAFFEPTVGDVFWFLAESLGHDQQTSETEANKFVDFYSAKGWLVGKAKMKDWKAASRNWMRRRAEFGQPSGLSLRPDNSSQQVVSRAEQYHWMESQVAPF